MTERPNGPSKEETEKVVHAVEALMADIRAEQALYKQRVQPLRDSIKDTIDDAVKEMGFDKKALKVGIKQREFLRKMEVLEKELDEVTQTALDRLQLHLGTFADLPLGRAAIDAARAKSKGGRKKRDPVDELVQDDSLPPDEQAAAE